MDGRQTIRAILLAVVLVAATVSVPAPTDAATSFTTHLDETHGHFLVGVPETGSPADAVVQEGPASDLTMTRIDVPVNPCHRRVELDLAYEPREAGVGDEDAGASVPYVFNVSWEDADGSVLRTFDVHQPRQDIPLGTVPKPAVYVLQLRLVLGADVNWTVRVQGWAVQDEPTCGLWLNEVELNPAGADTGNEWVELYNAGDRDVDVSSWLIWGVQWTKHVDEAVFEVPEGTIVPAGGFLQVPLTDGEFLDDVDEVVVLAHPAGGMLDLSDPVADKDDDDRTNQRVPDGSPTWVFADGTPGASNSV